MILKTRSTTLQQAAEYACLGAADLASDLLKIIDMGKNPEILEIVRLRCQQAFDIGVQLHTANEAIAEAALKSRRNTND